VVWQNFANVSYHRAEILMWEKKRVKQKQKVIPTDDLIIIIIIIKVLCWDVTVTCPLAESYINAAAREPGAAVELAASRKEEKYADLDGRYIFSLMFCGIEFQTFSAANWKALQLVVLVVKGTCRRLSEEERRGLGGLLKFISDER